MDNALRILRILQRLVMDDVTDNRSLQGGKYDLKITFEMTKLQKLQGSFFLLQLQIMSFVTN